ncbi:MAG: Rnf-Nqr domain containing protein, partial [Oscillospiraceae bacterium]
MKLSLSALREDLPALLILHLLFGSGAVGAGIYLPVFVADGIVLSRGEISSRESAALAFSNGFRTAIGLSGVLVIVGALRELLGEGKLFGT